MEKKYYWLKLKEDFFRQKSIKKLRKLAGGDTYTIIYLKMLLLAIKNDNKLYFEEIEDNFISELALDLDEDENNVKVILSYLRNQNLIEEITPNEYYLTECETMVGKECASAQRVRKHRLKLKQEKLLQCNSCVTKSNIEIEQEKNLNNNLDNKEDNIKQLLELNGFNINSEIYELILIDVKQYSLNEFKIALEIAKRKNKFNYPYLRGILEIRNQNKKKIQSFYETKDLWRKEAAVVIQEDYDNLNI